MLPTKRPTKACAKAGLDEGDDLCFRARRSLILWGRYPLDRLGLIRPEQVTERYPAETEGRRKHNAKRGDAAQDYLQRDQNPHREW